MPIIRLFFKDKYNLFSSLILEDRSASHVLHSSRFVSERWHQCPLVTVDKCKYVSVLVHFVLMVGTICIEMFCNLGESLSVVNHILTDAIKIYHIWYEYIALSDHLLVGSFFIFDWIICCNAVLWRAVNVLIDLSAYSREG